MSQTYGSAISIMLGAPTQTTDANNVSTIVTFDNFGRTTQTTVANRATLLYNYTEGMLSSIVRSADNVNQTYSFVYDSFGNVTSMKVGSRTLASYQYGPNNGLLLSQTYGNGDIVAFTYDTLGRVKTTTYDDGRVLTYTYNGEGHLYSVTETLGEDVVTYLYNYDTIGRLISSEKKAGTTSLLRTHQSYDAYNRLIGQSWKLGSTTYSESYTYNDVDNSISTFTAGNGETIGLTYDLLRRLSSVDAGLYEKDYTYREITEVDQTTQITGLEYLGLPEDLEFGYTYNNLGYIATYAAPGEQTITYTYDNLGQLLQAVGDVTYTYTYDSAGNILTANGHTYTYGDADWKDLLTAYDNQAITYDAIGNPLSYYNGTRWTFTWENGRSLATATNGTVSLSYGYDLDGMRTTKTVGNAVHDYYYAGGRLLREVITTTAEDETVTTSTLDFFYDASGMPYVLKYNGVEYYYITNLQGDVVSLVDPTSGVPVATYEYDPFGKVISATGDLATINPLRYRGYYYDTETGLYYVSSRYYDSEIGRWINADDTAFMGVDGTLLSYNLFTYCKNNPIMGYDPTGNWDWDLFGKVLITTVIVVGCLTGVGAIAAAAAAATATSVAAAVTVSVTTAGISTALSAVDGAICAQQSGGKWYDGAMAGAIGGSAGALVSSITNPMPGTDAVLRMNTAGRVTSSLLYDVSYDLFSTGEIKTANVATYAVDVTMDAALAPISYYYTGNMSNGYLRSFMNGLVDGAIDVFQTVAYFAS